MKLTTVLLIGSFLHLSAAGIAQNITFSKKNVTLEDVFTQIRKQSGFNIVLSDSKVNLATKVDVNFNNTPVEESIKSMLSGLPLSYKIDNNTIIIREQEKSLLDKVVKYFSAIDVRGRVVDENGKGLPGATVKVKGSTRSVLTNKDGEFFLANLDDVSVLIISYVGYDVKEVAALKDLGDVGLVFNSGKLEEVQINAGYYTVTDRERTGNISRITAEEIGRQPVNNPLMALVGTVPGLQITQSNGNPGGGFTVRVRGQNSINSGNEPLYIVDGVNYPSSGISSKTIGINTNLGAGGANPMAMISPNDIESIEILKDADATAIYGSRGANGVILITTKRGKQGSPSVNANISHGFNEVGHMIKLLNTEQYLLMRREAYFTNDRLTTSSSAYSSQYDINGAYDQNKYTDWQELLIGRSAPLTNAALNVTGGSGKSSYLIAANYSNEGTVSPGDFGFKRYGVRSNINLGGNENRFSASLTLNLSRTESKLAQNSGTLTGILTEPNAPDPYDQFGQLNWGNGTFGSNPIASLLRTVKSDNDNLISNLNLSYKILNNLVFKTSLGYSTVRRNELSKQPLAAVDPSSGATSASRQSSFGRNYNNNLIIEPQINYDTSIGKGKISVLVGGSLQHNEAQINVIRAANFTSDDLLENIASATTVTIPENTFVQYKYVALYSRLNYSYIDKYFLNLTARRDGSSRFGPGKQFANFGAIGAAWIFSEEHLVKDKLPFLSFGKLRGSYGLTGNDQIQDYRFLQLWNTSPVYAGTSTFIPDAAAPNPNFAWETNRKLEAAVQLGFLQDKLSLEVAWFRNRSSNQLIFQNLPLSAGQGGAYVNLPADVQNTGWEFDANLRILRTANWDWSTSFNLSIPKNKLLSYEGLATSTSASLYEIGQPLNILKTYNVTVDSQNGSYIIEDRNGNGATDIADRYLVKFLGQKYFGGFQNSVRYRRLSLDILFSFSKQMGRKLSGSNSPGDFVSNPGTANQTLQVLDRWQKLGDITSVAKYTTNFSASSVYSNVSAFGNLSLVDASYIRLRNISLSYDLPEQLISQLKIKKVAINLQGQNVFTLTSYKGLDPETGGITLPPLRTVMLGLNVTF